MSAPHEPGGPRDSLLRAQFAPDAHRSGPDDPARLALVLDNHDTVARLVRVELQSRRQQEVTLEVRPEDTRPEGGHTYDLHAVVIDEKSEAVVYTCSARIGVERAAQLNARGERTTPYEVTGQEVVRLRVHVRNAGNVSLLVDAQKVDTDFWVRDDDRHRQEQLERVRRTIRKERSAPGRTPERLRPRQTHDFDLLAAPPPYLIGTGPRRWWVPVGVRGDDVDPECVFVDFVQKPKIEVEQRMVWLAAAVAVALLVLIVFMVVLAT